jgi:membrane protease YdiL (CAAX protease family)
LVSPEACGPAVRRLIVRYPFAAFVAVAFGWTWPCALLLERSLLFPLLGLFGPLLGAVVVAGARGGRREVGRLFARFRVTPAAAGWSLAALALPVVLLVPVWLLHRALWGPLAFAPAPLTPIGLVLAVLIVGEEVGWRGFALPELLARWRPAAAGLAVGAVWALWHLVNFLLPGYPQHGLSFIAFFVTVTAYSILFTWFHLRSRGSLLVAVLFHAGLNLAALQGMAEERQAWLEAAVYAAVAAGLVAASPAMIAPKDKAAPP